MDKLSSLVIPKFSTENFWDFYNELKNQIVKHLNDKKSSSVFLGGVLIFIGTIYR